jgi:hypothetical protein
MINHRRHLSETAHPSERARGLELVLVWLALLLCSCAAWYAVGEVAVLMVRAVTR